MSELYLGLMSGTSLDGVDIAWVELNQNTIDCKGFTTIGYPTELQTQLRQLNLTPQISLQDLCALESQLGLFYANSINHFLAEQKLNTAEIKAIGSHGQTIFHAPENQMSLQLGHPAFIAKHTGITTVADFRIDDMANGGHGAPLAPAFHRELFHAEQGTVIVNIGGIANVSIFTEEGVIGFDTGPGNGIMDEVCQNHLHKAFDFEGDIAANHPPNSRLIEQLLTDPYFKLPFPKSTGRDYFNIHWLEKHTNQLSPEEWLATLNLLTAKTIALQLASFDVKELIICGGGAENKTLIQNLNQLMAIPVTTSNDHDVDPNAIEAMMMAWLAKNRIEGTATELQSITGADKNSVLGGIWHP